MQLAGFLGSRLSLEDMALIVVEGEEFIGSGKIGEGPLRAVTEEYMTECKIGVAKVFWINEVLRQCHRELALRYVDAMK